MKPTLLFHCSDPRLGRDDDRGRDRLRAFGRCVETALGANAAGLLVGGRMLEHGPPQPRALGDLESILSRARDGGLTIWTTCEARETGWLEYLSRRQLMAVLDVRSDTALPVSEPHDGLKVYGLGRPGTDDELERRMASIGPRPRGANTVLLIGARVAPQRPGITRALLDRLRARAIYVAVGDNPAPVVIAEAARDPGPLTRLDIRDSPDVDPGFLEVELGSYATVREHSSGDRQLVRASIDISGAKKPEAIDRLLRAALGKARLDERPLLRLEVRGTPDFEPALVNEERVLERARAIIDPIDCAIDLDPTIEPTVIGSRATAERAILEELTAGRPPGYSQLALQVFTDLVAAGADGSTAADRINRHVSRKRPPARASRASR